MVLATRREALKPVGAAPRGKTPGGSSSINGLIYIRGQREDYDHWAALGNAGWAYENVLPYFIKSAGAQRGAAPYHGCDGPLQIPDIDARHELIEAFIQGGAPIGPAASDAPTISTARNRKAPVTTNSPPPGAGAAAPPRPTSARRGADPVYVSRLTPWLPGCCSRGNASWEHSTARMGG